MPFTLMNLKDLEDVGSNFDGAPDLEFRLASKALELEQSGLSYQRIPPTNRSVAGLTPDLCSVRGPRSDLKERVT